MFGKSADKAPKEKDMSPVELAQAAKTRGDSLLQVVTVDKSFFGKTAVFGVEASNGYKQGPMLSEVESIGWKLEHVSATSALPMSLGKDAVQGASQLVTVYVFRNVQ